MRKAAKKTLMLYLAGANFLANAGLVDLRGMKKVGSTDQVSVAAQLENAKGFLARLIEDGQGWTRYQPASISELAYCPTAGLC
jgi:hypothetical protein